MGYIRNILLLSESSYAIYSRMAVASNKSAVGLIQPFYQLPSPSTTHLKQRLAKKGPNFDNSS